MISQKILFIDDEELILESIRRSLNPFNFDLYFSKSGNEALHLMQSTDFAVVVSDLNMPEMDGFNLLQQIHTLHPNTSRMVLTGYGQVNVVLKAIEKGQIQRFLLKPWNTEEDLVPALNYGLERYRLRQKMKEEDRATALHNEQLEAIHKELHILKEQAETANKNKARIIQTLTGELTPYLTNIMDFAFKVDILDTQSDVTPFKELGQRGMDLLSLLIKIKAIVVE